MCSGPWESRGAERGPPDPPAAWHTQPAVRGRAETAKPPPAVGQARGQTVAPARPYLALDLHEVLRHAAQGKDLAILSWDKNKPQDTSVMVGKLHEPCQAGERYPRETLDPSPTSPKAELPRAWPSSTGSMSTASRHLCSPCPGTHCSGKRSPAHGHHAGAGLWGGRGPG